MRINISLSVFVVTLAGLGCAAKGSHVPFSIPGQELAGIDRTIALAPVAGHPEVEVPDSSLATLDEFIERALVEVGFEVVTGDEYSAAWDRIIHQIGGIYDSISGELDEAKLEIANDQLLRDLLDLYHPDYILYPEVWVVEAEFANGVAEWDGASQAVVGLGTLLLNAVDAVINQSGGFLGSGFVSALSLGIVVEDLDGVEIFHNAGGIEVLKERDKDEESTADLQFEPVFRDLERVQRAVELALLPVLEYLSTDSPTTQ